MMLFYLEARSTPRGQMLPGQVEKEPGAIITMQVEKILQVPLAFLDPVP